MSIPESHANVKLDLIFQNKLKAIKKRIDIMRAQHVSELGKNQKP